MKPILIDEIRKDLDCTQEECSVIVDGCTFTGWQITKPLNYNKEYTTAKERGEMAKLVKEGKAIAVQFFEDLTEDEKVEYVKRWLDEIKQNKTP